MTDDLPHELALVPIDTPPGPGHSERWDSRGAGPGWWDSSWDLLRGLEVREQRWDLELAFA